MNGKRYTKIKGCNNGTLGRCHTLWGSNRREEKICVMC